MSDEVFGNRYRPERHLARGGMAEVYLARDALLDRPVALKALFPELSADRNFVERFRREAQAAANLNHPNIVSVFDWGEQDNTYFIVMEYVDGPTLRDLLRHEGRLHPDRVADIGAEIAAALDFAHRAGVIHRDVKPGNVLLSPTGQVKVTDFGIARAARDAGDNLTQTGTVMGTATYFSPEQASGGAVDARSDVYALGVVLYELVVGQPPFAGDSPVAIAYQHVREAPVPPSRHNPDVSPAFEAIVMKCLAKNPANRYASAEELRADLLRFRQGRPVVAEPVLDMGAAETRAQAAYDQGTRVIPAATTGVTPSPAPRARTAPYVVLLLVLLAALAVLVFFLVRSLGIGSNTATVAVPDVVGKPQAQAEQLLQQTGLRATVHQQQDADVKAGTVISADPKPGSKVDTGSNVTLNVSSGPATAVVPYVLGMTAADAANKLIAAGFQVDTVPPDAASDGIVRSTSPGPGAQAPQGSTVKITVASPTTTTEAPTTTTQAPTTTTTEPLTSLPLAPPTSKP
ncbi:MAG: Stk1 family PASTA domain-containing Ser/Thr kinase [Actinobacteria bacterium]|nr:MAG: Stk1 family PASTA domain-containing Ser/Thr kinase [Actinomycetota bacterium]